MRRLVLRRRKAKICVKCSSPDTDGRSRCERCIKTAYKHMKQRRKRGLCFDCSKPPALGKSRCERCHKRGVERGNRLNRETYKELIQKLGGLCACCGERNTAFLTIDHIHNDGYKLGPGRSSFYRKLVIRARKTGDWPKDLQVLCMNCNFGKHRNGGICPHKSSC